LIYIIYADMLIGVYMITRIDLCQRQI